MMRYFHELYYGGAGNEHDRFLLHPKKEIREKYKIDYPDAQHSYSFIMRKTLEMLLRDSLSTLSGIQQGGCQSDEEYENCEMRLRDAVRDIAMAITGQEIFFAGKNISDKRNLENIDIENLTNMIFTKECSGGINE